MKERGHRRRGRGRGERRTPTARRPTTPSQGLQRRTCEMPDVVRRRGDEQQGKQQLQREEKRRLHTGLQ